MLADAIWPGLLLASRLSAWWCIAVSLLLEAAALWKFARLSPLKAIGGSIAMNVASAFCGSLLLPILSLHWEIVASLTYNTWLDQGTFNPLTLVATWFISTVLSTLIETFVLWLVFCVPWTRRLNVVVLLANAVTTAMAVASIFIATPK